MWRVVSILSLSPFIADNLLQSLGKMKNHLQPLLLMHKNDSIHSHFQKYIEHPKKYIWYSHTQLALVALVQYSCRLKLQKSVNQLCTRIVSPA